MLLMLVFLLQSCGDNEGTATEIVKIKYGTSFGECGGYCVYSAEFDNTDYNSENRSWQETEDFPNIDCKIENPTDWEDLSSLASFDEFKSLDEVIGCPDCADGGAEFIELFTANDSYKVTFEFGTPPDEVSSLQERIREIVEDDTIWDCE